MAWSAPSASSQGIQNEEASFIEQVGGQVGETGREESHEVQRGEMTSPAPGER